MATRQTDKRDRLIQTAVALVYQQGFHHTTLADIAHEAQVPLGTVYYFFKTKEAIGEAVVEHHLCEQQKMFQQWDNNPDPKARLEAFLQAMLDNGQDIAQSGCPIGSLCAELNKQNGQLGQQASKVFDALLSWLTMQFQALGKGDASKDMALHLLSAVQGSVLLTQNFRSLSYYEREARWLRDWIRAL